MGKQRERIKGREGSIVFRGKEAVSVLSLSLEKALHPRGLTIVCASKHWSPLWAKTVDGLK